MTRLNTDRMVSEVEDFFEEARKRGVYGKAQDSLLATWKTLVGQVLPNAGVNPKEVAVGRLKTQLPEILKSWGSKSDVKPITITTYQTKGLRLLNDFVEHNGATDAAWFDWKAKSARKSAQAAQAANTRFGRAKDAETNGVGGGNGGNGHTPAEQQHRLKLPNSRTAVLHLPAQLHAVDLKALDQGFTALLAYLKTQVDVELMSTDEEDDVDDVALAD